MEHHIREGADRLVDAGWQRGEARREAEDPGPPTWDARLVEIQTARALLLASVAAAAALLPARRAVSIDPRRAMDPDG